MKVTPLGRIAAAALMLAATGCTTLREIPRADYAAKPERRDVRVHTKDGLVYEFDLAHVRNDSLIGYHRRDVEGSVDDFATVRIPLEDIDGFSSRGVDWVRTGFIGGGALAAVIVGGLSAAGRNSGDQSSSPGSKIPPP